MPEATQRLLLLAAAEPVGDATLLWRAADRLGIGTGALAPAEERSCWRSASTRAVPPSAGALGGLPGGVARRAAACARGAGGGERRRTLDADRRAWHRALAANGPDEDVAAELEHSAGRAQTRGGLAAAAAFLERAAGLTADPAHRARRALAAAQAKHQAGAPEAALALLASAQAGPLDPLQRAQSDLLRARSRSRSNRGNDAPALLLDAAKQLEPLDVPLARETYLDALMAAQFAGRFAGALRRMSPRPRATRPRALAARSRSAARRPRGVDHPRAHAPRRRS